ncbi:MAG: HesA/MoeB/ThiF family protein, partial [Clostridia bacterium]|nr:HesA/MoeB/ThiF family protein [Clostridia bacterium]
MTNWLRYSRQLPIPCIGQAGQEKLHNASAFVIGCGGLGTAALYCLASAGVGTIGFCDMDAVSLSNLNRQYLYTMDDVGAPKAAAAHARLAAYNPSLTYRPVQAALTEENAISMLAGYDVVLLAVDTLAARLAANRACVLRGIPLVNGGVDGFSGAVSVVTPHQSACLACLYGGAAEPEDAGASFAPIVSIAGALEAQLALLLLLGAPDPLGGRLLTFSGGTLQFDRLPVYRDPHCPVCG